MLENLCVQWLGEDCGLLDVSWDWQRHNPKSPHRIPSGFIHMRLPKFLGMSKSGARGEVRICPSVNSLMGPLKIYRMSDPVKSLRHSTRKYSLVIARTPRIVIFGEMRKKNSVLRMMEVGIKSGVSSCTRGDQILLSESHTPRIFTH